MSASSQTEDRKFAVFSPLSIQTHAEAVGISDVSENILYALAEDVSYRVREIISKSTQFMSQARRTRLKSSDVDKALYWSDVPPVIGAPGTLDFVQIGDVACQPDTVLNLKDVVASAIPIFNSNPIKLTSKWLVSSDLQSPQTHPDAGSAMDSPEPGLVSNAYTEYYTAMVECILGDNKETLVHLIDDLKSNTKIAQCLPYMVNFLSATNLVSHDLGKLSWMLYVINALFSNPAISLDNYLMPLVKSVMYCVLEPLAASISPLNDHWILRDYGARLLAKIVYSYPNSTAVLLDHLQNCIKLILTDPTRPLCSHYGAVVTSRALGFNTVTKLIFPNISEYISDVLGPFINDLSITNVHLKEDSHKVFGAIKGCVEQYFFNPKLDMSQFFGVIELFADSITSYVHMPNPKENDKHQARSSNVPSQFMFQYKLCVDSPQAPPPRDTKSEKELFETKQLISMKDIFIQFGRQRPVKRRHLEYNPSRNITVPPSSYPSWYFGLSKMHASRSLHYCDTTHWCL